MIPCRSVVRRNNPDTDFVMPKDAELIELLVADGRISLEDLAASLGSSPDEIATRLDGLVAKGAILGFTAVVDSEHYPPANVTAFIEVKITPERGGYDSLADRIARFSQVKSCYLMSGGYDLFVSVQGPDLRDVARFISDKLSPLEGVLSTATHFQLKVYKENNILYQGADQPDRLAVSP